MTTAFMSRLIAGPKHVSAGWFAIPLRIIIGLGFIEHGYAKILRGPGEFINILHAIGVPFANFFGWITIVVELLGGAMVFLGTFVPLASIPMLAVLLVATVTVHLPNGFSSIKLLSYDSLGAHFGQPGYETDLLYAAGLIALCIGGAGPLALGTFWTSRAKDRARRSA